MPPILYIKTCDLCSYPHLFALLSFYWRDNLDVPSSPQNEATKETSPFLGCWFPSSIDFHRSSPGRDRSGRKVTLPLNSLVRFVKNS
jgi:hypothetical protein